jgi:acyl-CoA oxidase
MGASRIPLWQTPALRPVAPLVLAAWEDNHLTPAELLAIRGELEQGPWLDEPARSVLRSWLEPASPPTPQELRALERHVDTWGRTLPTTQRGSAADLAWALAQSELAPELREAARQTLLASQEPIRSESALGASFGLGSRDLRARLHGVASKPTAELAAREQLDADHRDKVADLRDRLEPSDDRATRDQVRALLSDSSFRPRDDLNCHAFREQVLAWCRQVADSGVLQRLYPQGAEGGRDIVQFAAIFETLAFFDLSLVVKFGVQFGLFANAIDNLGTERHRALLPAIDRMELVGCFAMTERAHGSNVRDLRTVARYEPDTQSFLLHTPDLTAGKEWIGNAAQHARMAVVFAQLETLGESYGVHAFLVPIRNAQGELEPGVRVEDCGEKMGLNGVDNGRLWFESVRVPRSAPLDRFGQVSEAGEYTSSIPSSGKRFFTMLGTLVGGRICVAGGATAAAKVGLGIALGYAQRRTQFPDEHGHEKTLLSYLAHQRRLLPRLAATYAYSFAQRELVRQAAAPDKDDTGARELERLAAGLKALGTWHAVDTLQQCREACGGQGYLTANRIDALRTDSDVFTTFEGDNTVLLQLVAKELLFARRADFKKQPLRTVARTVAENVVAAVAKNNPIMARAESQEALTDFDFQEAALRFRERTLLDSLGRRISRRVAQGMDAQQAFDACQDHALSLARAHVERVVLEIFRRAASEHLLLERVCALYGLWRIEADLAWFLENSYFATTKARAVRKQLNRLLGELTPDTQALVDAFGVPPSCAGPLADPEYLRRSGLTS